MFWPLGNSIGEDCSSEKSIASNNFHLHLHAAVVVLQCRDGACYRDFTDTPVLFRLFRSCDAGHTNFERNRAPCRVKLVTATSSLGLPLTFQRRAPRLSFAATSDTIRSTSFGRNGFSMTGRPRLASTSPDVELNVSPVINITRPARRGQRRSISR